MVFNVLLSLTDVTYVSTLFQPLKTYPAATIRASFVCRQLAEVSDSTEAAAAAAAADDSDSDDRNP